MESVEIREFFRQETTFHSTNASNKRGVVRVDFHKRAHIPEGLEEDIPDVRACVRVNDHIKRRRPIAASLV